MPNPKCPKCPYGKDDGIVVSNVKNGTWYCTQCGSYFKKIGDVLPPDFTVKSSIKLETDPVLKWTAEEVDTSYDRPLAQFYAALNSEDREDMQRHHIALNGDFRL